MMTAVGGVEGAYVCNVAQIDIRYKGISVGRREGTRRSDRIGVVVYNTLIEIIGPHKGESQSSISDKFL